MRVCENLQVRGAAARMRSSSMPGEEPHLSPVRTRCEPLCRRFRITLLPPRPSSAEQRRAAESAPTSDLQGLVKVKCLRIVEFMDLFFTSVQKMCCLLGFSHLVKCCLQKICVFGPGFSHKPCGLYCASVRGREVFRNASLVWPRALRAGAFPRGLGPGLPLLPASHLGWGGPRARPPPRGPSATCSCCLALTLQFRRGCFHCFVSC